MHINKGCKKKTDVGVSLTVTSTIPLNNVTGQVFNSKNSAAFNVTMNSFAPAMNLNPNSQSTISS